jgi:hypothetical protein
MNKSIQFVKCGDVFLEKKPLPCGGGGEKREKASSQELEGCLVILKASHPFRPIIRLDTTSLRPGTMNIEIFVPIQRP